MSCASIKRHVLSQSVKSRRGPRPQRHPTPQVSPLKLMTTGLDRIGSSDDLKKALDNCSGVYKVATNLLSFPALPFFNLISGPIPYPFILPFPSPSLPILFSFTPLFLSLFPLPFLLPQQLATLYNPVIAKTANLF